VTDHVAGPAALPGAELVDVGIADLASGRETIEALLVASAAERFAELGRPVPFIDPNGLERHDTPAGR